ncbi:MAG: AraC family transcriptional regulator [Phaeodactylibacter sp.]|nr:AraC family transcriptional regulator [Phaeodactylibacter sp.]
MNIPLSLAVLIIGAIIAQGIFASVLLLLRAENRQSNRYLAIFMFLLALWLCDTFFKVAHIYDQDPNFYLLPIYYSLAFGPLIYFYSRSITENGFYFRKKHLLHFIPVALQAALYVFLQTQDYRFRRNFWFDVHRPYTYDLEFQLSLLSLLLYLSLSLRFVIRYQHWINNRYSEVARIDLRWLKFVLRLLLVLAFFWGVDALLRAWVLYYPDTTLSAISIAVGLLFLAGGGILQPGIRESKIDPSEATASMQLSETEIPDPTILAQIQGRMEQGKAYLEPKLTLHQFAQLLGLPERLVSFHINQGLGLSFIDFVNRYRVQEVLDRLNDPQFQHLSLLGLALECGFNSKSTFNRVFKKMSGESPSAAQKRLQNGKE